MANGYNPYNIVGTQQGLLESLLQSEQSQKTGALALGEHKGEMSEEFQKEQIAAQKEQERLLQQSRKKGFLEKLLPLAGMFMGPAGSGVMSGLTGMYGAKKGSDFAKQQIEKARGAGISDKWGGTFLGQQQREITSETDTMFDKMKREADISDWDLGLTGLTSGISGYATGKMGEGIGEGIKGVSADREFLEGLDIDKIGGLEDLDKLTDDQFAKLAKITGEGDTEKLFELISGPGGRKDLNPSYLKAIFGAGGLGQDPSKLLEEGGEGSNILKNLLMMLAQQGGR